MNTLLEKPNLLSIIILLGVVVLAGGYGVITYTQRPEMSSFDVDEEYAFDFDFKKATRVVTLPKDLDEISGLCAWEKPDEVLAIQDEDGKIFVVNTLSGKVTREFSFSKDRDYEGLTRKGDTIIVLEADGDLHRFRYRAGETAFESEKLETPFSYRNDTEGIAYDPLTGNILIAPKEQELNPSESDQYRKGIYSFDLASRTMNPQPDYYIDELEVGAIVYGKKSRYVVKPSGLAVDPITNDIYVIASVGNILIVIDRESNLKHIELLETGTFKQPEGIAFNDKGDLFISSEGRGGDARLAVLAREKRDLSEEPVNE